MENLKHMKDALIHKVQAEINGNLDKVDAHELGEAVDMIKDFAQAIYYCTITEAMEENAEREEEYPMEETERMYYPMRYYPRRRMYHGDDWYGYPHMGGPYYYSEGNADNRGNNARGGGSRGYSEDNYNRRYHEDMADAYRDLERAYPREMRDYREGKSGMSRRYYMEAKENHKDQSTRTSELNKYMQELSEDIVDMIQDASVEEKQILQQKLTTLANKIK